MNRKQAAGRMGVTYSIVGKMIKLGFLDITGKEPLGSGTTLSKQQVIYMWNQIKDMGKLIEWDKLQKLEFKTEIKEVAERIYEKT